MAGRVGASILCRLSRLQKKPICLLTKLVAVLSCLVFVLSCLVVSCLVLSGLVLSGLVWSRLVLPCLSFACHVLSRLALPCLVWSCLALLWLARSCPVRTCKCTLHDFPRGCVKQQHLDTIAASRAPGVRCRDARCHPQSPRVPCCPGFKTAGFQKGPIACDGLNTSTTQNPKDTGSSYSIRTENAITEVQNLSVCPLVLGEVLGLMQPNNRPQGNTGEGGKGISCGSSGKGTSQYCRLARRLPTRIARRTPRANFPSLTLARRLPTRSLPPLARRRSNIGGVKGGLCGRCGYTRGVINPGGIGGVPNPGGGLLGLGGSGVCGDDATKTGDSAIEARR